MSVIKKLILSIMAVSLVMIFVACQKEGPLEKAGKTADKPIEDAKEAIKEKTE